MPWTKEKWREYNRQYYLKHRDQLLPRHRESVKRWREEHPERALAYKRENKEKTRLYKRRYYQKHREELLAKKKKWREEHPKYFKKWREKLKLRQKEVSVNIIVVRVPYVLGAAFDEYEKKVKKIFPNRKVLILDGGADIKIINTS